MAYKHVIRAKTKNLLSDISVQSPVGVSYDKQSGIFTINSNDKTSIGYSNSVMDFITPIPVGTVITVSIYCISGRYKATQGDNTGIGGYHKYTSSTDLNIWQGLVLLPSGTDLSGKTFTTTWTVTKPLDAFWIYVPRPTDIIEEDIKFRAQLELGSTATPYTPYNYLQSNKRMIKVSEVCQLVPISDKEDGVVNGVTFTNNHNGTWTLSGTSTADYSYYNLFRVIPLRQGHIYLNASSFGNAPQTYVEIKWINKDGVVQWGANPYTADENSKCDIGLLKLKGNLDTVVLCPQLFDLTEMFGTGHEPATVAEFRQRFPNELYPYSPQCWLTSYKSAVVCKTKNLFDVNNAVVINYSSLQETTDTTHYVKDGIVYTDWNSNFAGTCVGIKGGWTLPAGTYTVSAKIAYNTRLDDEDGYRGVDIGFACVFADDSKIRYIDWVSYGIPGSRIAYTAQIPAGCKNIMLYLSVYAGELSSSPTAYCELMVEQGSTATSYVPYQHL